MSKLITLSRFSAALTSTFQKKVNIFRPATPQSSRILQRLLSRNGQINSVEQEIASLAVKDFGFLSLQIQHHQLSKEPVCILMQLRVAVKGI